MNTSIRVRLLLSALFLLAPVALAGCGGSETASTGTDEATQKSVSSYDAEIAKQKPPKAAPKKAK